MLKNQESENCQSEVINDEIDLVDLFLIIWKRKMMILVFTLLLTIVAVGVSLIMPKVYNITAIMEPGRDAEDKPVGNPQAIRENILGGAYDKIIADQLSLPLGDMPEFKVVVPKNTDLVKISIESSEPEVAVKILDTLLNHISKKLESLLENKKKAVKNRLEAAVLKERLFPEQIRQLNQLIEKTDKKILDLDNTKKKAGDPMALLLYLNEIQNQQVFLNSLYQKVSELNNEREKAVLDVEDMRLKLASMQGTRINKQPSIPEKPIKPKKTLIVALAFILGLMGGVILAFMAEFMDKVRRQQKVDA